jgi:hypothetical protein
MSYPGLEVPASGKEHFTDYRRWRLLVNDGGRHTWHYLRTDEECDRWPQNSVDKYWLGLPLVRYRSIVYHWLLFIHVNIFRTSLFFRQLKTRCPQRGMGMSSTKTSSQTMVTGQANMAAQCFLCQG